MNANISIKDYQYTNRDGIVVETPLGDSPIQKGDRVLVHHNVFRKYWGFSTHLRTSSSDLNNGLFGVNPESIYAYDRGDGWVALDDWLFVEPIEDDKEDLVLDLNHFATRVGKLVIGAQNGLKLGDTVAFTPLSEYEFKFDGNRVYRMRLRDITARING